MFSLPVIAVVLRELRAIAASLGMVTSTLPLYFPSVVALTISLPSEL